MEVCRRGSAIHRGARPANAAPAGLLVALLLGLWGAQALEMNVGKIPFLEAVNGSTVLLPCTYASCIGIQNLYFKWMYNDNGTMDMLCDSVIPEDDAFANVITYKSRVEFVGEKKNVSILLWNITFDDEGEYICFGRNPKEKHKNHSAIFTLYVVDEVRVIDNTLTKIIASIVGGVIGSFVAFMLMKNLTLFVLAKMEGRIKSVS
ncbi:hypothetical protein AAFF_G00277830 [Aldrovandia affinis]|uniref:Ig-like domain-containing protein n=1 Tax=Aldrovandia affinis TaxID=143900 RepID=A0AAD7RA30_9TELE|nr:hypothetical protein AAFF_G00277830 [Aldrovandia affinis]